MHARGMLAEPTERASVTHRVQEPPMRRQPGRNVSWAKFERLNPAIIPWLMVRSRHPKGFTGD
jgi:hypothetical protein